MRTTSLFLLGMLAACSSDDEDERLRGAVEDHSRILCERLFACCAEGELAEIAFVDEKRPPTYEGCIAYHRKVGESYLGPTKAAADRGNVAIHLERSAACADETRALACSDLHERLLRVHLGDAFVLCNSEIVEPLVEDGGACETYLECTSGYCVVGGKGAGTCRPIPKTREACPTGECALGLRCAPETRTCVGLVAKGGTCTADDECESGACRDGRCISPGLCGG
jgi:hypothetical protein